MTAQSSSTRDHILKLLKKQQQLTVASMAKELGITEMAVRRHLNILERDGIVTSEMIRQPMGRPTNVYSLSKSGEELFPRNYADLTLGFLKDIEELAGKDTIDALFKKRKERFKEQYQQQMDGKPFEERIETLAQIQNQAGYMVEWEMDEEGGYLFKEYNCPISKIAKEYPIACHYEQALFREVLGAKDVECEACIALDSTSHCFYKIKK